MQPVELIMKKKRGHELMTDEINAFVAGIADASMADYQLSALLMAICLKGMTERETIDLTMAMAHSGEMLTLTGIDGVTADKHSTGGVGDTTTLILAPLVAACGVKVAKMSGRGLGHTGGTLDKLESIPGLSVDLSIDQFIRQVNAIGCAVMGQTAELAPADKALYALRDVTGTVDSLPLIASSILSKKLAAGCACVVLDVKSGGGALMPTLDESIALARLMVKVGNGAGRKYSAIVTDMDQPLGRYIGNALEVEEAILVLSGRAKGALLDVSLVLGAHMLKSAGRTASLDEGQALLLSKLRSGEGLDTLARMIDAQGGDARVTDDVRRLPHAAETVALRAERSGVVSQMDTIAIGNAARLLGAGRFRKEDAIDPAVGLVMAVRLGDAVQKGDRLCTLHVSLRSDTQGALDLLSRSFTIGDVAPEASPLVHAVIGGDDQ